MAAKARRSVEKFSGQKVGSQKAPARTPDNLFSSDHVELLLGISEGPIGGLVDGGKSFYVNDTPLINSDDTPNFKDFELIVLKGEEVNNASIVPRLGGLGNQINAGLPVNLSQGTPIVRQLPALIPNQPVDYIEIRLNIQRLFLTNSKGEFNHSVEIMLEIKPASSSTWVNPVIEGYSVDNQPGGTFGVADVVLPPATNVSVQTTLAVPGAVIQSTAPGTANRPAGVVWFDSATLSNIIPKVVSGIAWVNAPGLGAFTTVSGFQRREWTTGVVLIGTTTPTDNLLTVGKTNFWINGNSVYQHNGSSWVVMQATLPTTLVSAQPRTITITGKTTSGFIRELRLPVARINEPYDVRLTKISPNSNGTEGTFTDIAVESIAAISTASFNFPGLATVQVVGRASDQLNNIPELSGIYQGRIIRVPTNYDPVTKVYTGVWDGNFKMAVSSNPAWVAYDLVMNTRYGLNAYTPVTMDKVACYLFGQHCDTYGFEYNDTIRQPRSIYEQLDYICGIAGGKFVDYDNGFCTVLYDAPDQQPVAIFTRENVEPPGFVYSFTDLTTVKNDWTVSFVNPDLGYREDQRRVFNQDHITAHGRRPDDFIAVGCRSAAEAIRRARLRLVTSLTEKAGVTFKTNRVAQYLQPFDTVLICDGETATGHSSARILSSTLVTGRPRIMLRDPVFLETGFSYTIQVQTQVGGVLNIEQFTLGPARGTLTQLDCLETRASAFAADTVFTISTSGPRGSPKRYRVTTIEPDDKNPDNITVYAIEVNPLKWAYVAGLIELPNIVYTPLRTPVSPPVNITVVPFSLNGRDHLRVQWSPSLSANVRGYNVLVFRDDSSDPLADTTSVFTNTTNYVIEDVQPVDYTISVSTVNILGMESLARSVRHSVRGNVRSVLPARNLRVEGSSGALYYQPNPVVVWDAPESGVVEDYNVEIVRVVGNTVARSFVTRDRRFTYPDDQIRADNGGSIQTGFIVRITARDGLGNVSAQVQQTFQNVVAQVTNLQGVFNGSAAQLSWDYQWAGGIQPYDIEAVVRVYTSAGGALLRTFRTRDRSFVYSYEMNLADSGPRRALHFQINPVTPSGVEGLPATLSVSNPAPASVTFSVENDVQAFYINIFPSNDTDLAGYRVWASQTINFTASDANLVYDGPDSTARIRVAPGTWYVRAAAYDRFGKTGLNVSAAVMVIVTSVLVDTVAPPIPTGLTLTTAGAVDSTGDFVTTVRASWTPVAAGNLGFYEVEIADGPKTSGSLVWDRRPVGTATAAEWTGRRAGSVVSVRVRSGNQDGFTSGWSIIEDITIATNTTPPGDVSAFTAAASGRTVFLDWTNPGNSDLREVEIWESATSVRTAGSVIARVRGTNFIREGLAVGAQRWYWARTINTSGTAGANFVASNPVSVTVGGLLPADVGAGIDLPQSRGALVDKSNAAPYAAEPNLVFLTTDRMLYRKDSSTANGWTRAVPAAEVTGQLASNQIADAAITTAKFAAGLRPVEVLAALPGTPHTQGRQVFLTTDNKLYRNTGSGWVATIPAVDITGQLTNAQLAAIASTKITGQLTDAQLSAIAAAKITGQLASSQIADAAITTAKFAAGLRPVEVLGSLPGTPHSAGRMVFLTTDNKLYRNDGTGWVATIPAADVTGQLTATQIAAVNATAISGTLTDSQLAGISSAKLIGQVVDSQLAAIAATKITGQLTAAQIAAVNAASVAGTLTDSQLAAISASKLVGQVADSQIAAIGATKITGQITTTQITDNAISSPKIAAGAVTAEKLVIADFENLAENPHFGEGDVGWVRWANVTIENDAPNAFVGNWVLKINTGATGLSARNRLIFPVVPGQEYYAEARAKSVGAGSGLNLRIRYMTADKSTLVGVSSVAFLTTDTAYTLRSLTSIAPATAAYAWVDLTLVSTLAAGRWDVGMVRCQRRNAGELIVDGSITAAKIAANTITASQIAAGTITATQLAANSVTAAQIATGAVTAGKVAANAITAAQIAANAVTASKIVITDTSNIVKNPNFIGGSLDDWGGVSAALPSTDPSVPAGAPALHVARRDITTGIAHFSNNSRFSVRPGETYYIEASVASTANANSDIEIRLNCVDVNGGNGSWASVPGTTDRRTAPNTTWGVISGIVTVPATIAAGATPARAQVVIYADGNPAPLGSWFVTNVVCRRATDASLIVDGTITAAKIAANTITASQIAAATLTAAQIAAGAITATQLAANSVTATQIAAGAVTAGKIAANAVTAAEIAAGAVTAGKIAANAITATEIAANAVTAGKIAAGAITATEIASEAITTVKIAAGAVTATEIGAAAVTTVKIAAGAVTANEIAANTITAAQIAASTITAAQLAANSVTATQIAAGAVVAGKIAANTITATEIAAGAVTAGKIAANAVTATEIAANAVTAGKIAAGAITATELAVGSVTATRLLIADTSNIVKNPSFAGGSSDDWSGVSAVLPRTDLSVPAGAPATHVARRDIAVGLGTLLTTSRFAVRPGETYYIEAAVASTANANAAIELRLSCDDVTNVHNAWANDPGTTDRRTAPGTTWAIISGRITVPATVGASAIPTNARVIIYTDGNASPLGSWFITNVVCRRAIDTALIVDGTITAGKIAAGTITGDRLVANTITGGLIAANAIGATQIAANAVTADKIAAGAVTSAKLTVAASRNMIYNSDFLGLSSTGQLRGWASGGGTSAATHAIESSDNVAAGSTPSGMKTGVIWTPTGTPANGTFWDAITSPPNATAFYPCVAGQRYEFSSYLSVLNCTAQAMVFFYDAAGTFLSFSPASVVNTFAGANARLGLWPRSTGFATAPATAARMALVVRALFSGAASPTVLFTGCYLGEALPNQTEFSPWGPASSTIIHGDQMQTGTLNANRIVAGSIQAAQIGANAVQARNIAINSRGLHVHGVDFQIFRLSGALTNTVTWSAGSVAWTEDNGLANITLISSGSFDTAGSLTYFFWQKGLGVISASTSLATVLGNPDNVIFASYQPGSPPLLTVTYGGTIIDGSRITALSIQAAQIAAGAITADKIQAGSITADRLNVTSLSAIAANMGTVTAGIIRNAANTFVIDLNNGSLTLTT